MNSTERNDHHIMRNVSDLEKLKFLAENFDPFSASTIPEKCLVYIDELGLDHLLTDPFSLTNEVLRRMHPHHESPLLH